MTPRVYEPRDRHPTVTANRDAWGELLDAAFVSSRFPARSAPFSQLPLAIRFYVSVEDGECSNERDLGGLREDLKQHYNGSAELLSDLQVLRCGGPRRAEQVCARGVGQSLRATDWSLQCVTLWREVYGARCGVLNKSAV